MFRRVRKASEKFVEAANVEGCERIWKGSEGFGRVLEGFGRVRIGFGTESKNWTNGSKYEARSPGRLPGRVWKGLEGFGDATTAGRVWKGSET